MAWICVRCYRHSRLRLIAPAAIDNNVVALCDFSLVANDLYAGRLVRPFDLGIKAIPEYAYHLVYPLGVAYDPRIAARWILAEAKNAKLPA